MWCANFFNKYLQKISETNFGIIGKKYGFLAALEKLRCCNVICSEKTGILTTNKMKVKEIRNIGKKVSERFILELSIMCNSSALQLENDELEPIGEPMENAILLAGLEEGIRKEDLYDRMEKLHEIPFDSTRKLMTTIHRIGNKYRVITKGAPEILLKLCNRVYDEASVRDITDFDKNKIIKDNVDLAEKAYSVLAVAYKDLNELPEVIESNHIEKDLIFVGLIGMSDEQIDGVVQAINDCKKAGIKPVMITGDHLVTAKAIARDIGIYNRGDIIVTGRQLDEIDDNELQDDIMRYSVFARVEPEQKVRIVEAFKKNGCTVAMIENSLENTSSISKADIEILMDETVNSAKDTSDILDSDDCFVTVVQALKKSRYIYNNIIKAVHLLISTYISQVFVIIFSWLIGTKSPFTVLHLLWINLIIMPFPAFALAFEKTDNAIINKKDLFDDCLSMKIIFEGCMLGVLTLIAFFLGTKFYGISVGRTMAFVSMVILGLIQCFNIKSKNSILNKSILDNKDLFKTISISVLLQVAILVIPNLANMFDIVKLNIIQWMYIVIIAVIPIVIEEIQKRNNFKYKKSVILENAETV